MKPKVLICEISGKRPGDFNQRTTERFDFKYEKLIISNNSEDYITDWKIINVPQDFEENYKKKFMIDEKAYYAPMNRSYAIQYAKKNGYDYLIQLDDNIKELQLAYIIKNNDEFFKNVEEEKEYRIRATHLLNSEMINEIIDCLILSLEATNCGIAGCNLMGSSVPSKTYLREGFVYSLFALKLSVVPDNYQGGFEDDIEFRYKLFQMGIPSIQHGALMYGKVSAATKDDETGCRKAYKEVGVNRGKNMRKLYGEWYSAGVSNASNAAGVKKKKGKVYFKHKMKVFKLGIIITNSKAKKELDDKYRKLFKKYATEIKDSICIKEA